MPRAVILTALPVEYSAVRAHLTDLRDETHPQGTVYERGKFAGNGQVWEVGIAEVGAGNAGAAIEAERAIVYFKPDILFFVGIAGGIKDVAIGDVVAATKVYGYESGKAENQFFTRPTLERSAYALVQRARSEARKEEWSQRLSSGSTSYPRVFVAPIAAGEKVIASKKSDVFDFIRGSYNDAIAVEMEGFGFLSAAFAYPNIKAIVIRGISDLIQDKNADDPAEGAEVERQERASRNASAFAFEVLAKFPIEEVGKPSSQKTLLPLDSREEALRSYREKAKALILMYYLESGGIDSGCQELLDLLLKYSNLSFEDAKKINEELLNAYLVNSEDFKKKIDDFQKIIRGTQNGKMSVSRIQAHLKQAQKWVLNFSDLSASQAFSQLGFEAFEEKELEQAEFYFKEAIDISQDSPSPSAFTGIGFILLSKGASREAARNFRRAVMLYRRSRPQVFDKEIEYLENLIHRIEESSC